MRFTAIATTADIADLARRLLPRGMFWSYCSREGTLLGALLSAIGATLQPAHAALHEAFSEALPGTATAAAALPAWESVLDLAPAASASEFERQSFASSWYTYRHGLSEQGLLNLAVAHGLSARLIRDYHRPPTPPRNNGVLYHRKGRAASARDNSALRRGSYRSGAFAYRLELSGGTAAERASFEWQLGRIQAAHIQLNLVYI